MGSGTTAISALHHNRTFIGIDISPEYINLATNRLNEAISQLKLDIN
jgi:DNA modification methylase